MIEEKFLKKAYVLNIRKTNAIIQDKRLKRNYNNTFAQNKAKILSTTFNHNIIFIKNVTKKYLSVTDISNNL